MMSLFSWLSAWCVAALLDYWLGDPHHWPHPVRWMGNLVNLLQRAVRHVCHSPQALRWGGGVMWLVVVAVTGGVSWGVLVLAERVHPLLGWVVNTWMIFTLLAGRCLAESAGEVEQALRKGDLPLSREKLSWIVGRDTSQLQPPQITRAVVETVAENSVDGVIAPLFFLMLGGAPLAMAYKAVNTLDSMVGYKNARYKDIGLVSARMDDVANYLPARIGWLLLSAAARLCQFNGLSALRIGWRDRKQHSSPNCAWSEGAVAGALGVRLGGPNNYFGERVEKPWIGENLREITPDDIPASVRMLMVASGLALVLFALIRIAFTLTV